MLFRSWATDEGWWSFGNKDRQMKQHYTFLEELNLPAEVRHKIYRGNAEKLFNFKSAANPSHSPAPPDARPDSSRPR